MNKTLNLTKGGILSTLGFIFIYLSTITPTSKIYLLGIASCIIPIAVILTNVRNAFLVYVTTSILSFLILGFKGSVIAYIVFFGLYGFVKFYVEKLRKLHVEIILKLLFFNLCIGIIFLFYQFFFVGLLKIKIPIYMAVIIFQFVFLAYDYALTSFISYISKRFINKI